ncbi:amino acid adenylation protein [Cupriavidus basilensis OR16]|uniref:Amino acid adenylation protein n=1 Tax=Cupriavidus basilensis OR16 TaxID=1127483 RepID=H1RY11_9BURK|nr:AMP-binding protein [Cupriavidus basilensis]EHP44784.1 amino acid adenylation protein [Cupriavidus basilensis OR16]
MQQTAEVYAALLKGQAIEPPVLRFGDFASWQHGQADDPVAKAFWDRQLVELPVLSLATDRPRPAQMDWTGSSVNLALDEKLVTQLETLATQHNATLFMVLLSTYQLLLGRYSQQDEVVVGTYVAGREHPASLDMLGCFVNNVIMRTPWEPKQPFDDFLRQNRERIVTALAHQHYPFERLVAQAGTARDDGRHPLYQAGFAMRPRHRWPTLAGGLRLRQLPPPLHTAHMDLDLYVAQDTGGLWLELNYLTSLFDGDRMQRLLEHYRCLLEAIVARPQERLVDLRYWPEQSLMHSSAQSDATIDLPERLLRALQQGADRCALYDGGQQTSFAQLLSRSQGLAAGLLARGVAPGAVVGVYLPRSSTQICTMLAILFVGAVYLPLDPDYPPARIEAMLSQARPALLVSDDAIKGGLAQSYASAAIDWRLLEAPAPTPPLCCQPLPQAPMYLLFTSGSTGTPKGLFGNWLTAQSRTRWLAQTYPLHADDCCAIRTPLNFVDSLWEILDPLLASCSCVVLPTSLVIESRRLLTMMLEYSVTRMVIVPSLIRTWLRDAPELLASWQSLNLLLSSAEAANTDEVETLYRALPNLRFVNCYGSSEVADVTAYQWPRPPSRDDQRVLGKPIAGNQIHLLDKWGHAVPPGNCGHIHVGGDQIFSGYLRLARQQAVEPGSPPFGPLFAMGDWGYQRADGKLVFQGRLDDLAKIRGNRVELAEVNHHLAAAMAGGHAVALVAPDPHGGMQLVAWLEAAMDCHPTLAAEVREALSRQLPAYMVPTRFEVIPHLPRLPNGKVDRGCLLGSLTWSREAPAYTLNDSQQRLAEMIAPLIGCDASSLDPRRGLYEMGLNSLSLASLHAKLQAVYPSAVELSLTELFQYSTIDQLVRRLEGVVEEDSVLTSVIPRSGRAERFRIRIRGDETKDERA